ncbi:MAG: hypothetical protein ACM3PY_15750 [Omnitrophica WOR_2 bacterium]
MLLRLGLAGATAAVLGGGFYLIEVAALIAAGLGLMNVVIPISVDYFLCQPTLSLHGNVCNRFIARPGNTHALRVIL